MKRIVLLLSLLALAAASARAEEPAAAPAARRVRFKADPDRFETNGWQFAKTDGGWALRGAARNQGGQYYGIPSVVGGQPVVAVADGAFAGHGEAVWIDLPSTVERLGRDVFAGCTNLQNLGLNTRIADIPDDALAGCAALAHVHLPGTLRSVGARAFKGTAVNPMRFPATLRSIGEEAFAGTRVSDLQLAGAESLTSIGPRAFAGCRGLKRAVVPAGLREIGDGAFEGCAALGFVHRLERSSVERIGDGAFRGCASLHEIDLPDTLREIGAGAFAGCSNLAKAVFTTPPETAGEGAFAGCTALDWIEWPDFAGAPPESLFPDAPAPFPRPATDFDPAADPSWTAWLVGGVRLFTAETPQGRLVVKGAWPRDARSVAVPKHIAGTPLEIEGVGEAAFAGLEALETARIDWRIGRVGARLFEGCVSLREASLPAVADACPDGAFRGCRSLRRVEWLCGEETRGAGKVGAGAFEGCEALDSLAFLGPAREAGARAFAGCTGLRELAGLPLRTLGPGVFADCSNLVSVAFSGNPKAIPDGAFEGCAALESVGWDAGGRASVGARAFAGCAALRELRGGVGSCGAEAFAGCAALERVRFDTGAGVGRAAFRGCVSLRGAALPGTCTFLGARAFEGCSNLVSASVPGGVGEIPPRAFAGCTALAEASVADGVRVVGPGAFEGCAALRSFRAGGAEVVGDRAFAGCSALSSAVFSHRLSAVGREAFAGTALEAFAAPGRPLYVGERAFGDRIRLLAFAHEPPVFARPDLSDLPEGCVVHVGLADDALARWKERNEPAREVRALRPGTTEFSFASGGDAPFLESAARLEKEAPAAPPAAARPAPPPDAEAARKAAAAWTPGPGDWRGLDRAAEWAEAVRTNAALRTWGGFLRESVRPVLRADLLAPGAGPLETALVDRLADVVWSGELPEDDPAAPLWADLAREARAALEAEPGAGPVPRWLARLDAFGTPGFEAFVPPPDAPPLAAALAMRTAAWRESVREEALAAAAGRLVAWCAAHADRPGDSRVLFHVCDALLDGPAQAALAARLADSAADPWVADMLEARANVRESKRRNANVGIPENWTAARAALLRAWNRAPDRPEAAVQLQEAAMWGGAGDPELWFARAVHLEADIPLAYHYQWHYAYLPKWGGSREKLLAFAEACRATGRHDTMIPAQAYALLNEVRRLEGREDRTRHLLVEPPERLAMVEEVLAPLATNENATISFRAFGIDDLPLLLLWGGEPEKAADAYARTRPLWREPMARQFADFPVEERALRGLCGPHRAELCAMERDFHARKWTDVLARAEALRALPDLAPEERESLEARLVEASLRSVYARGEWVDVGQHPSGAGWKDFAGTGWEPAPDGGYRHGPFAPDAAAGLQRGKLRWTGWNAPPRFDVETTVRFDPAADATNRWFALCPDEKAIDREKVGVPVLRLEADGPWLVVRFDSEKELLSGEAEELARVPFAEGEPVRLALRGRFMFLDVEINGKTVLESFKPKGWNYPRDERRRLWVAASGAAFSDMRVRAVKPSARVPDLGFPLPPNVRASRWICGEYSVDLDEPSPDAAAKDAGSAP